MGNTGKRQQIQKPYTLPAELEATARRWARRSGVPFERFVAQAIEQRAHGAWVDEYTKCLFDVGPGSDRRLAQIERQEPMATSYVGPIQMFKHPELATVPSGPGLGVERRRPTSEPDGDLAGLSPTNPTPKPKRR